MTIENNINKAIDSIGKVISWFTTILVLIVIYDVFVRYVLNESSTALQELTWHIFSIIFLLGAAYTFKEDGHVRVDVFYQNYSPKTKAFINILGILLFVIPFTIVIIVTSIDWTINSFIISEVSPDPGGLAFRFLIKAVLPISFILLFIQSIAIIISSINIIRRK